MGWLVQMFRNLVYGRQVPHDQLRGSVLAYLRKYQVSSPQLIAAELRLDLGGVDTACGELVKTGRIRRSAKQIVKPDPGEEIPAPFVRYELAS